MITRHRRPGINRNRCEECRRRNKRCEIESGSKICKVCEKKGLECKLREFQPIYYQAPHKRPRDIEKKQSSEADSQVGSHTDKKARQKQEPPLTSSQQTLQARQTPQPHVETQVTPTDAQTVPTVNLLIRRNIILHYLSFNSKGDGLKTIRSSFRGIYEKRISISSLLQGNILEEATVEVPLIDSNTNFESRTNRKFGFNGDVQQFFKKVPEYIADTEMDPSVSLFLKYSYRNGPNEFTGEYNSLQDIDDNCLKNEIFLEMPSLISGNHTPGDNKVEGVFINLPGFIPISEVENLLNYFCINFPANTNRILYETNDCTDFTQELLGVYLSLAFSNILVLKAIFLWSVCHQAPSKQFSFMEELQAEIVQNVNHRIQFISAVCCDHTIATLFLLIEAQSLRVEGDARFWPAASGLLIKAISLRGGFEKFSESHNGRFFCKVFKSTFFTKFIPVPLVENTECLSDIKLVDSPSEGYVAFFDICAIIGRVFHLYGLMDLAKNASDLNRGGEDSRYRLLNDANIIDILHEGQALEEKARAMIVPNKDTRVHFLTVFLKEATILLIYQLIYNQTSSSGRTLLQMKRVIPLLDHLWNHLKTDDGILPVLPLFVIGNDIHDAYHRNQFLSSLDSAYATRNDAKLVTVKRLVQESWKRNTDGNTWVAWPDLIEQMRLIVPIYSSI